VPWKERRGRAAQRRRRIRRNWSDTFLSLRSSRRCDVSAPLLPVHPLRTEDGWSAEQCYARRAKAETRRRGEVAEGSEQSLEGEHRRQHLEVR
jgi:hypothetical protein